MLQRTYQLNWKGKVLLAWHCLHLARFSYAVMCKNCALCDKSVKFGTKDCFYVLLNFRYEAILKDKKLECFKGFSKWPLSKTGSENYNSRKLANVINLFYFQNNSYKLIFIQCVLLIKQWVKNITFFHSW